MNDEFRIETDRWLPVKCKFPLCEDGIMFYCGYNDLNTDLRIMICNKCLRLSELNIERHDWKDLKKHHPDYNSWLEKNK